MHERHFFQLALFILGLVAITPRVFAGERHFLLRALGPTGSGAVSGRARREGTEIA